MFRTLLLILATLPIAAAAQMPRLTNGDCEKVNASGSPTGWQGPGPGYTLTVDATGGLHQSKAVLVSSVEDNSSTTFGVISEPLDAAGLRGKHVRFRAAVRAEGKAMLWFRVDRPPQGDTPLMGAFDNMQDRPITSGEWKHYDIVGRIDDDAVTLNVGLILSGKGKAWLDDASVEIVDASTPVTAPARASPDHPQTFHTPWLWCVLLVLGLFALAHAPNSWAQRFGLRFSVVYWLLYLPPSQLFGFMVNWTRETLFKAPPSPQITGSGDTTDNYVMVFLCLVLGLVIALVWSLIDRRKEPPTLLAEGLRISLRYMLAATLLAYGLAKTVQFPAPRFDLLITQFGDVSPMGLLWRFMGVSESYKIFAGVGEVLPALLLIWRRTALIGALLAAGVMANVVALNFCYDVPVKQFSTHLLVMALFIAAPDFRRLVDVFFRHCAVEAVPIGIPGLTPVQRRVHRGLKACVVILLIVLPIIYSLRQPMDASPSATGFEVTSFKANDPKAVRFRQLVLISSGSDYRRYVLVLDNDARTSGDYTASSDGKVIELTGAVPMTLKVLDADHSEVKNDRVEIKLRRKPDAEFLIYNRGFHWVSEYPFNR